MVCPCTIYPSIIEKYPHHIFFFLAQEIYDIYVFIIPSHDDVVISFANMFDYLSLNLIAQHISFCK